MPVSKVLLKVSPADDISQAVTVDVTAAVLATGKVVYDVGVPNAKRWFFVVLIDDAGNTSVRELGSFTTDPSYVVALNVPLSGDAVAWAEANFNSTTYGRLGVTADTVSFDGSGGLRVNPALGQAIWLPRGDFSTLANASGLRLDYDIADFSNNGGVSKYDYFHMYWTDAAGVVGPVGSLKFNHHVQGLWFAWRNLADNGEDLVRLVQTADYPTLFASKPLRLEIRYDPTAHTVSAYVRKAADNSLLYSALGKPLPAAWKDSGRVFYNLQFWIAPGSPARVVRTISNIVFNPDP